MSKRNISLLIGIVFLVSTIFYGTKVPAQSSLSSIGLSVEPTIEKIFPFEAEAEKVEPPPQFSFKAIDGAGRPIQNAKIHLQILTPSVNPFLTTDFPIVEGTKLLDVETIASQGELKLQQMMPIRGNYTFKMDVAPAIGANFEPFQQIQMLSVQENGIKYQNLIKLLLILFAIGLVGGWIIGARQPIRPGEIAPKNVRLLLSGLTIMSIGVLLYINVSAELAQSHMSMAMDHKTKSAPSSTLVKDTVSQGLNVRLSGDTQAMVGQAASLQVTVLDFKTQKPVNAQIQVTSTQLEHDWTAFSMQGKTDTAGQFAWQQQFFDGAPHKVVAIVSPLTNSGLQFTPIEVGETLEVEGVAPPLQVRLTSLTYFVGMVALGLLTGLFIRRSRRPSGKFSAS